MSAQVTRELLEHYLRAGGAIDDDERRGVEEVLRYGAIDSGYIVAQLNSDTAVVLGLCIAAEMDNAEAERHGLGTDLGDYALEQAGKKLIAAGLTVEQWEAARTP